MSGPTAEAVTECDYNERNRPCREPGVHQVQLDGKKYRFCERHVRPEFHPPDLHKRLPGPVQRATRRLRP